MSLYESMRKHSTSPFLMPGTSVVLVDGAPSRSACGHLSQLEVHQLLHSGEGGDIPRWT